MSTKVELAAALAKHFHTGQKYGNHDYFSHHLCGVVAYVKDNYSDRMQFTLEDAVCVAYLHDSVEDTSLNLATIIDCLGYDVGHSVECITKFKDETRESYLRFVKKDPMATFVKICDAEFNRDSCLADGNEKRAKYYQDTIDYLKGEN